MSDGAPTPFNWAPMKLTSISLEAIEIPPSEYILTSFVVSLTIILKASAPLPAKVIFDEPAPSKKIEGPVIIPVNAGFAVFKYADKFVGICAAGTKPLPSNWSSLLAALNPPVKYVLIAVLSAAVITLNELVSSIMSADVLK